jgi:hypothetical protein
MANLLLFNNLQLFAGDGLNNNDNNIFNNNEDNIDGFSSWLVQTNYKHDLIVAQQNLRIIEECTRAGLLDACIEAHDQLVLFLRRVSRCYRVPFSNEEQNDVCILCTICLSIIKASKSSGTGNNYGENTLKLAWICLSKTIPEQPIQIFSLQPNIKNIDENIRIEIIKTMKILSTVVELGIIECISDEISNNQLLLLLSGDRIRYLLAYLVRISEIPRYTHHILDAGCLLPLLTIVGEKRDVADYPLISKALSIIFALLGTKRIDPFLVDIVQVCKLLLPWLNRGNSTSAIECGYQSLQILLFACPPDLLCQIIDEYPIVISFYSRLLFAMLDSGKRSAFYAFNQKRTLRQVTLELSKIGHVAPMLKNNNNRIKPIYRQQPNPNNFTTMFSILVSNVLEMLIKYHQNAQYYHIEYGIEFLYDIILNHKIDNVVVLVNNKLNQDMIQKVYDMILSDSTVPTIAYFYLKKIREELKGVVLNQFHNTSISNNCNNNNKKNNSIVEEQEEEEEEMVWIPLIQPHNNNNKNQNHFHLVYSYHNVLDEFIHHSMELIRNKQQQNWLISWIRGTSNNQQNIGVLLKDNNEFNHFIENVQSATCIIVFANLFYEKSAQCRFECQYARKMKKPILFVVMDDSFHFDCRDHDWLGKLMISVQSDYVMFPSCKTIQRVEEFNKELIEKLYILSGGGGI